MTRKLSIPGLASAFAVSAALASVGGVGAQDATTDTDTAAAAETPAWTSSITVPTDEAQMEADEAAALEPLVTVTADEATTAALANTPGTVESVLLESEDGNVVYSVLVTDDTGALVDVKVDAGNATVLEALPATDEAAEEANGEEANDTEGSGQEEASDAEDHDSAEHGDASEDHDGASDDIEGEDD